MKEQILFQTEPLDTDSENFDYDNIMQNIESVFEPSILIGTVGRWNGTFNGFKYCQDFTDLKNTIGGYDDIIIRQVGTRLFFKLYHHDGQHEMELRRFTDYGYDSRGNVCLDYFNEYAVRFINRHTRNFGKLL